MASEVDAHNNDPDFEPEEDEPASSLPSSGRVHSSRHDMLGLPHVKMAPLAFKAPFEPSPDLPHAQLPYVPRQPKYEDQDGGQLIARISPRRKSAFAGGTAASTAQRLEGPDYHALEEEDEDDWRSERTPSPYIDVPTNGRH